MTETRDAAKRLEEQWWWRHANNFWAYHGQTHTTTARTNWTNVCDDDGPIRVTPFVDEGEEHFRTILVTEPWKGPVEWSAHAYELIRRAEGEPLLRSYWDLNLEEQRFLLEDFGGPHEPSPWIASTKDEQHWPGFSDPVRWNLMDFSDADLVSAFEQWLRTQRKAKHVQAPDGGKNRAATDPSWQWPEVLDLDRCGLHDHMDFDATVLRQAKARATQLAIEFWETVKHTHMHGLEWPGVPEPEHSVTIV